MSKKKYLIIFVLMTLLMSLGILGFKHFNREGDTSNVKTIIDEDSMYSKEDIDEATSVIFNEFKKYPAKMESLSYDEKKCEFLVDEYKDKYNEVQALRRIYHQNQDCAGNRAHVGAEKRDDIGHTDNHAD